MHHVLLQEPKAPKKSEKPRKEKVIIEIEPRFQERPRGGFRGSDNRRGGGDRRGRGRGNGNRARQNKMPLVNIQDDAAFPSLGATA